MVNEQADVVIVGAGAAGLMAAIVAGRTYPDRSILIVDGAQKLGAKILVAGGGRCNVTHDQIDVAAYAGSSRNAIKKVLRRFDVPETVAFFSDIGVEIKREETGKLFPVTDSAKTVLNALLAAAKNAGVMIRNPYRVQTIEKQGGKFCISGEWGSITAARVILATGGKSLPKTGSDGHGYQIARSLSHQVTPRIFPALVPLTLPPDHFIPSLSGITVRTTLDLRSKTGRKLVSFTDSTLLTHFGLSGPSVLDMSRYYLDAKLDDSGALITINWLPDKTPEMVETELQTYRGSALKYLALPERLGRAICAEAAIKPELPIERLNRDQRRELVRAATQLSLPITGDRGYNYAEVTAGGVPLSEIRLETMESRVCPGLYLCGEVCDVDGRIGGYNFQWAWSSGYVAGVSVLSQD